MPDNVDLFPGCNFLKLSFELSFCSSISAESKCSLGAAKVSLTEPEEGTELATGYGCLWQAMSFSLLMSHSPGESIFSNAFAIYNYACNSYPPLKESVALPEHAQEELCHRPGGGRWSAHIHHGHKRTCQLIFWHSWGELCVTAYVLVTIAAPKPWFTDWRLTIPEGLHRQATQPFVQTFVDSH